MASIGENAFVACSGLAAITIPENVTNISANAFHGAGLTTVTIPSGVTSMGEDSFECPNLTNATISSGITAIGDYAFEYCTSLTSIMIPDTVTNIGAGAFNNCRSLVSVTIPANVTNIDDDAFEYCTSLLSVFLKGNAPAVALSSFFNDLFATAFYLPGTTGWGSTFGELPAFQWNAQVQIAGTSFGVMGNQFGINVTGNANTPIVLEACTNLAHPVWFPLQNLTLTNGSGFFSEPLQTNNSCCYYRLRSP
jgi:hypothetical protein